MNTFFAEDKPSVDCSFITDFEDHIFVTVDADAFFFLHDLISSYVREKERVVRCQFTSSLNCVILGHFLYQQILASAASNQRTQSPELQKATVNGATGSSNLSEGNAGQASPALNPPLCLQLSTDEDKKRRILEQIDWRNYECKTWHLEPTVRYNLLIIKQLIGCFSNNVTQMTHQVTVLGRQTNRALRSGVHSEQVGLFASPDDNPEMGSARRYGSAG